VTELRFPEGEYPEEHPKSDLGDDETAFVAQAFTLNHSKFLIFSQVQYCN